MSAPQCFGGFADVWKGQHNGQVVAAKALRVYTTSDLDRIKKVGRGGLVVFISEPTTSRLEVLQGSCDVEDASSSKRAAAVRCDDDRESVRDGIRVDREWEHQHVCEGAS